MAAVAGIVGVTNLLNIVLPLATNVITMLVHKDGTTTAIVYLDEADTQIAANQKQITDWFAAKGRTLPPA
jgi:hypothetical protein